MSSDYVQYRYATQTLAKMGGPSAYGRKSRKTPQNPGFELTRHSAFLDGTDDIFDVLVQLHTHKAETEETIRH